MLPCSLAPLLPCPPTSNPQLKKLPFSGERRSRHVSGGGWVRNPKPQSPPLAQRAEGQKPSGSGSTGSIYSYIYTQPRVVSECLRPSIGICLSKYCPSPSGQGRHRSKGFPNHLAAYMHMDELSGGKSTLTLQNGKTTTCCFFMLNRIQNFCSYYSVNQ